MGIGFEIIPIEWFQGNNHFNNNWSRFISTGFIRFRERYLKITARNKLLRYLLNQNDLDGFRHDFIILRIIKWYVINWIDAFHWWFDPNEIENKSKKIESERKKLIYPFFWSINDFSQNQNHLFVCYHRRSLKSIFVSFDLRKPYLERNKLKSIFKKSRCEEILLHSITNQYKEYLCDIFAFPWKSIFLNETERLTIRHKSL
jgi:hypothetical protein